MLPWDKFFTEKIKLIAQEKTILDIGGGFKFQKSLGQYRQLFADCDYKVFDNVASYNPDILGDVQDMKAIASGSIDAVICKAVLEHVPNPWKAAKEISRVLKPGGKCLVYVPFLYAYHAEKGVYGDYYRYTLDGLRFLFSDFSRFEYAPVRGRFETIAYLLPAQFLRRLFSSPARLVDRFFPTEKQVSGYHVYLVK
ncbi:MAG: class I SAM-dependent methyltransferase [bacterium]|nr:class I SAM-dependent methyltransferase [bacterium]